MFSPTGVFCSAFCLGGGATVNSPEIRAARIDDLPRLTQIYNHYVIESPATFDLEPKTLDQRREWFAQFRETGRHRLLVGEEAGVVLGYAGTTRWRPKPAYDTTVETTIYCAPEAMGRGTGATLRSTVRGHRGRGCASGGGRICAAESGVCSAARAVRIPAGGDLQPGGLQIRNVLGRVLAGEGGFHAMRPRKECNR